MKHAARDAASLAVLALALFACLASSSSNKSRRSGEPAPALGEDAYWCHTEYGQTQAASLCRPTYEACEAERQTAVAQGLTATYCAQVSPVACFQLGGRPEPQAEWCAASLEDCAAWREVDLAKNGGSGPCAWRY